MVYQYSHELLVLVNNKQIPEYYHEGTSYVEGRKGSAYELKLRNRTGRRALYVVSIDGKSVIDGKPCGVQSPGYVIDAYGEVTISGWKLDQATAAKFEFSSREKSYSNQSGEGTDNTGVIGAMVFFEKWPISHWPAVPYTLQSTISEPWLTGSGSGWSSGLNDSLYTCDTYTSRGVGASMNMNAAGSISPPPAPPAPPSPPSYPTANVMAAQLQNSASLNAVGTLADDGLGLGTAFGQRTEFHTTSVTFQRENETIPNATLVIEYDSKKGLERRGIVVSRSHYKPNPFPAGGCTPPAGWRG